jgi:hypothetical protein
VLLLFFSDWFGWGNIDDTWDIFNFFFLSCLVSLSHDKKKKKPREINTFLPHFVLVEDAINILFFCCCLVLICAHDFLIKFNMYNL